MTDIVNAVTRVTDIMGEIASASGDRVSTQVAIAVAEMDSVTQQNASWWKSRPAPPLRWKTRLNV